MPSACRSSLPGDSSAAGCASLCTDWPFACALCACSACAGCAGRPAGLDQGGLMKGSATRSSASALLKTMQHRFIDPRGLAVYMLE